MFYPNNFIDGVTPLPNIKLSHPRDLNIKLIVRVWKLDNFWVQRWKKRKKTKKSYSLN